MTGWLLTGVLAYAGLVAVMYSFQRSFLYFPSAVAPVPADYAAADMQVVPITLSGSAAGSPSDPAAADGLSGWYRPPAAGRRTLVYFHGNAGHIGDRAAKIRPYLDAGYGVFLAAYRGYGGHPGRPTEAGLYADARAAVDWLLAHGDDASDLVLYGESLGTGVAVQIGTEYAVSAIVLEAPFSSVVDVGQARFPFLPVGRLMRDRFDSAAKIARVDAPVLILHGERDLTVPIRFGRRLYAATVEPRRFELFPEAGHNDLYDHGAAERVLAFLAEFGVPAAPAPQAAP